MLKPAKWLLWLAPILALAFILALVQLFQLRYAAGDVYPAYSSLRADPLGTKALFESYSRVGGLQVRRHLGPVERLAPDRPAALFFLGLDARQFYDVDARLVREWERIVRRGGRLIISFAPEAQKPWRPPTPRRIARPVPERLPPEEPAVDPDLDEESEPEEARPPRRPKRPRPLERANEPEDFLGQTISLKERWGVALDYEDLPRSHDGEIVPATAHLDAEVTAPGAIQWKTALFFDQVDPSWRAVYSRGLNPVLIERELGRGSIVLSADSYYLSNQAMRQDCYPGLLAWLVASQTTVVFDETHLGVAETPGVAGLARKYRLHGVLAAALLLAALFVWKSTYSLVPAQPDPRELRDEDVGGRDSAAGLVNLLRRSIAQPEILFACFDQWKVSTAHPPGRWHKKLDRMEAILAEERALPPKRRNPVQAYQRLSRVLAEKS